MGEGEASSSNYSQFGTVRERKNHFGGHVFMLQLNKCETDPYFLQNFQCTRMYISAFCKICELNTEREIVFVLISVDSQSDITQV